MLPDTPDIRRVADAVLGYLHEMTNDPTSEEKS